MALRARSSCWTITIFSVWIIRNAFSAQESSKRIKLNIVKPKPGDHWQEKLRVEVGLSLEVGEGDHGADFDMNDLSSLEMCYWGGLEAVCSSVINGAPLPLLQMAPPLHGLAEIIVWIQRVPEDINTLVDSLSVADAMINILDSDDDYSSQRQETSFDSLNSEFSSQTVVNPSLSGLVGEVSHVFIWEETTEAAVRLSDLLAATQHLSSRSSSQSTNKLTNMNFHYRSDKIIQLIRLHMNYLMCDRKNYIKNGYGVYTKIVGFGTYGLESSIDHYWGSPDLTIKFGKFCSIGARTEFFLDGNHRTRSLSTYPFREVGESKLGFNEQLFRKSRKQNGHNGNIVIGNDVWIGEGATILSGVHIGDGAIIGTKSIVTKDVLPYGIYAGNPAKLIRFRFSNQTISKLVDDIQWWNWDYFTIEEHIKYLLSANDLEEGEEENIFFEEFISEIGPRLGRKFKLKQMSLSLGPEDAVCEFSN